MENCFVSLKGRVIIDAVRPDGKSWINGSTLAEIQERHPDAQEMSIEDAVISIESTLIDGTVTEITEEQFEDAFLVHPPKRWIDKGESESFMSTEHFYGNVTSVYVRVHKRFFTFKDRCTISHAAAVSKVHTLQAADACIAQTCNGALHES